MHIAVVSKNAGAAPESPSAWRSIGISDEHFGALRGLEESLGVADTRFDANHMKRILAAHFLEFGRSGRIY
jgi:hypothetical protein